VRFSFRWSGVLALRRLRLRKRVVHHGEHEAHGNDQGRRWQGDRPNNKTGWTAIHLDARRVAQDIYSQKCALFMEMMGVRAIAALESAPIGRYGEMFGAVEPGHTPVT
jgi:hypothetical protein